MAKVQFSTSVNYKGTLIPAFTPVEVDDKDFDKVVKSGAHVLEHPKKADNNDDTNEKTDINQGNTKDDNSPTTSRRRRR